MKSIYKLTYKLLIFSFVLGMTSCELEHEVYDKINTGIFPTTEADVEALITANAYFVFGPTTLFSYNAGYMIQSDHVTDHVTVSWGWQSQWNTHEADLWLINNAGRRVYDNSKYLAAMTLTMDRIKDVDMDEALLARYMAELKCGLGFLSFVLYDMYGPIPVADLETLKNPIQEKILPRLTEEQMISYIETNLLEAAAVLPYKHSEESYGRFTKGLANTLLLKLYMMTDNWTKAEAIGRELLKAEYDYALVEDYHSLFTLAGERNSEVIFASTAKRGFAEHQWHAHAYVSDFPTPGHNITKWNGYKMAWPFWETYNPSDIRRQKMVGEYTGTDGTLHSRAIDRDGGVKGLLYDGAMPEKYGFEGNIGYLCEIDIPVYRYADVLTLLAEAIVRNGNAVTGEAIDLVNQVRVTHGGLDPFTSFASVEDFLAALLLERGHEFPFEGVRRQDLIRHGKFIPFAIAKNEFEGQSTAALETMVDGQYKYEKFPIPTHIITEGKGEILQNPGF